MGNIRIIENEGIAYVQFNKLLEYENSLFHGMTLKLNDVGFSRRNSPNIRKNSIEKIQKLLNIKKENIIQLRQMHTSNIIINMNDKTNLFQEESGKIKEKLLPENNIDEIKDENIKAVKNISEEVYTDGIITNNKNLATIITTADCIPIIIYDPRNKIVANVHSGWKGTVKKIGLKAVKIMIDELGSDKTDLIFCIEPNIRKDHFLVNDDVVEIYEKTFKGDLDLKNVIEKTEFTNQKGIQYRIDNTLIYRTLLKKMGLLDKNIIDSELCTMCDSDKFHSRRCEGKNYQVNGSIAMLK